MAQTVIQRVFKRVQWLITLCALLLYIALLCKPVHAAETIRYTQAHMQEGADLQLNAAAVPVALPHDWNALRPQKQGTTSYFIDFKLGTADVEALLAIYIPRIGNRYEVYVNDELIHTTGSLTDTRQFLTHKALLTKIPKTSVFVGINSLKVLVAGEAARYAGLSSIYIGDFQTLNQTFNDRQLFQSFSSLAIVIICLFIAFMTIFYSYVSNNKHFLLFGLGALAWALNNSYLLLTYFPYNYRIALFFYDFFYALGICLIFLTTAYTVRIRAKWFPTLMIAYLYFSFFALVVYHDGYPIARTVFLDGTVLLGIVSFLLFAKASYVNRKKRSVVVFIALLTALGLGVYDQLAIYHHADGFERLTYSRYAVILFIIANATSMAHQFIKINQFVNNSHSRMSGKLQTAKHNLQVTFNKKSQIDKKLTLQQERWRLMQDMHDGLGHRLISLQQAVQDPKQTGVSLNLMVKQTIDELRTTIQSINQPHDNVSFMLGDLRERLDFLCSQYKKQLQWSVDEMPTLSQIDELRVSSIEKILLELFTNIAKHSNATRVKLTATFTLHQAIVIVVEENGAGFNPQPAQGTQAAQQNQLGLLGIQRRAKEMMSTLQFEDDGKLIRLTIPLQ